MISRAAYLLTVFCLLLTAACGTLSESSEMSAPLIQPFNPTFTPEPPQSASPILELTQTVGSSISLQITIQAITAHEASFTIVDRQEWYSLIRWTDTCNLWEQEAVTFGHDLGGIRFNRLGEDKYLAIIDCETGPNWVASEWYLINFQSGAREVQQLHFKTVWLDEEGVLQEYVKKQTIGTTSFNQDSEMLSYLDKSGGLPACRHHYLYRFEENGFVLREARQWNCEDDPALNREEWERIYVNQPDED
jgi:hypothetical protein